MTPRGGFVFVGWAGGLVGCTAMKLGFLLALLPLAACADAVPKDALDRCRIGPYDGNDQYVMRQPVACRIVAQQLVSDGQVAAAATFARRACEMQDAQGCEVYLSVAARTPSEVLRARSTGEKACDGMVVSGGGEDPRPRICYATGELYDEVSPKSRSDAERLYARACKMGDARGCTRSNGASGDLHPRDATPAQAAPRPPPLPPPPPTATVVTQVVPPPCHEMRACVSLDVSQHNDTEVVGTMTNHCDHPVQCRWCPAHGTDLGDKAQCKTAVLATGESRTGRPSGLWYDGFNGMAYDCVDEHDVQGCLSL